MRKRYIIFCLIIALIAPISCDLERPSPARDNPLDQENPQTGGDPFKLMAEIAGGGIQLTWTQLQFPNLSEYHLYKKIDAAEFTLLLLITNINTTNYTDTEIQNGHTYSYYVVAADSNGNETSSNTAVVTIHYSPIVSIDDNNGFTLNRQVNLTLLSFGAVQVQVGTPDLANANWEEYASTKSLQLETGAGLKIVQARFTYADGETSAVVSDTTLPAPMSPAVQINHDSIYAETREAILNLSAQGALWIEIYNDSVGSPEMMLSDLGPEEQFYKEPWFPIVPLELEAWIPYSDSIAWELSTGAGMKTVYVKFKDDFEIVETVSDEIQPLPISVTFNINRDSLYTPERAVYLYFSGLIENLEGKFCEDANFTPLTWSELGDSLPFTLSTGGGQKTVYGLIRDDFEIESEILSDLITPLPMNPEFNLEQGADTTATREVWLYFSAQGENLKCKYSEDSTFSGLEWQTLYDSLQFTLSAGSDTKIVYSRIKNDFEVVSPLLYDQIEVAVLNPNLSILPDSLYINHNLVSLYMPAVGAVEMKLNNEDDSTSVGWQPYQENFANFNLGSSDGLKYAYAWFRNDFYVAGSTQDSVWLDTYCQVDSFYWESTGGDTIYTGDTLKIYLHMKDDGIGIETGGSARSSLGAIFNNLNLLEQGDGAYCSYYLIQIDDYLQSGTLTGDFSDRAHNFIPNFSASSPIKINLDWIKHYGGTSDDLGCDLKRTPDGGYILAGNTASFGNGQSDIYVIKTDASGDTLWTKTYGGAGQDYGYSIALTPDNGYIIAGYSNSFGNSAGDAYILKLDASGNSEWERIYGGNYYDESRSIFPTNDGGYIFSGCTWLSSNWQVYLVRINSSGDTVWTENYGGDGTDKGYCVKQTMDGGFLIVGLTESYGAGGYDVYLIKTDDDGDTLWTRTFGESGYDYGYSFTETSAGDFLVCGYGHPIGAGESDVYLIKTDASGNEIWHRYYGGSDNDFAYNIYPTSDGGYLLAGGTYSYGASDEDLYLIKVDISGNEEWHKIFGGAGMEEGRSAAETTYERYTAVGFATSSGAGGSDVYLVNTRNAP